MVMLVAVTPGVVAAPAGAENAVADSVIPSDPAAATFAHLIDLGCCRFIIDAPFSFVHMNCFLQSGPVPLPSLL
jgi:hypothetical protein